MRRPGVRPSSAPPFIFNHLQPPATVAVLANWPATMTRPALFAWLGRSRVKHSAIQLPETQKPEGFALLQLPSGDRINLSALPFSLALCNKLRLLSQCESKCRYHLDETIQLCQTLLSGTRCPQEELDLDPASAISDAEHVMAALVFTTLTRFNLGEHIRCEAGRNRRQKYTLVKTIAAHHRSKSTAPQVATDLPPIG